MQRLAQRVPLGASGAAIPVITGRPSAGWVGEAAQKPASSGSIDKKVIQPKKLASIFVVSAEVARLNPGQFVTKMQGSFAETFAVAFDYAALHDAGPDGTAGAGPFDTYVDQTTKTQEIGATAQGSGGTYGDLVSAIGKIVSSHDAANRRYRLTGWAMDDVMEPALLQSVDTNGRPIYIDTPLEDTTSARGGRLIGRPSFMGEGVASPNLTSVVGYGGDWSQAAWGAVGGISYRISTEATVTINGSLVSLFENNLVAVLAEAEYGFLVNDPGAFIKLTNVGNSPVTSS
ncbi:phage major capsid protein [Aquihabitans sp. G128]|uniref:phage major capsid protein n=1 Tax=Aquihabitans sp. G128 TaxID=2849779 RepID=UPI001C243059|nr:phage major capsid protein [Aquihabitans sp. G128]QXC59336.1 phage major capsid protein [Aquihabitans sp. G128]